MITRKQYMEFPEELHSIYFSQFVTDHIRQTVLGAIGLDAIKNSTDDHFNDIPLKRWDAIIGWIDTQSNIYNVPDMGIKEMLKVAGEGISCSTMICIFKEAARIIKSMYA